MGEPMRILDRPQYEPHACATCLRGDRPVFDPGVTLNGFDPQVYLCLGCVESRARDLGWTNPQDREQLDARVVELEQQLAGVTAERDELNARFAAIDVLASAGFSERKRPGRPAKPKAVAA